MAKAKEEKVETTELVKSEADFDVVLGNQKVVGEDENFITYQNEDGTYSRKMKYHEFSSIKAESKEEKLNLVKLLDGAVEMKNAINKEIAVGGIIMQPYSQLDPETGNTLHGATTTIITPDFKKAYVTSSKTFYNKAREMIKLFGTDLFVAGEEVTIIPTKTKGQNYDVTTFVYAD